MLSYVHSAPFDCFFLYILIEPVRGLLEQVNLFVNICRSFLSLILAVIFAMLMMLSRRIVYLLVIIAVTNSTDVLKLTDTNFDTSLAEKQLALVNFHTAKYVRRRPRVKGGFDDRYSLHPSHLQITPAANIRSLTVVTSAHVHFTRGLETKTI